MEEIINNNKPAKIPPICDEIPFYWYRSSPSDKSRNLIHVSVGTWPTDSKVQKKLLNLLDPLYNLYMSEHKNFELDFFGKYPSSFKCSRYSFNLYPERGFLEKHVDNTDVYHPLQTLLLLNSKHDLALEIYDENNLIHTSRNQFEVSDTLCFDCGMTHRVVPNDFSEIDKNFTTLNSTLNPFDCFVECVYVNSAYEDTKKKVNRYKEYKRLL